MSLKINKTLLYHQKCEFCGKKRYAVKDIAYMPS